MVIPIGGGMGSVPSGPPPPALHPRLKKIKLCLFVLIAALVTKLLAGVLLYPRYIFLQVWHCLNPILNTIVGVFLLKDEREFSGCYNCIMNTCLDSCRHQCPGGMSCLLTWVFCNTITFIFEILPFPRSDAVVLKHGIEQLGKPSQPGEEVTRGLFCCFLIGTFFALLAQLVGAYQGYRAYEQAASYAAENLGEWAQGDAGGREQGNVGQQMGSLSQAPSGGSRPAAAFQVFSGQGQRLGS